MACYSSNLYSPRFVGDPVDVTTGANIDQAGEFQLPGPIPFVWQRYYNSFFHCWDRPLGWGHTHEYDHELRFDIDGLRYTGPSGRAVEFDAIVANGGTASSGGYRLTRISDSMYSLRTPREISEIFAFPPGALAARVNEMRRGERAMRFIYNGTGFLERILLADHRQVLVTTDERGRIHALMLAGPEIPQPRPLITYWYDSAGNLVEGVDAYHNRFSFRYDEQNRMVRRTDRRGYSMLFEYDAAGRCTVAGGEDGVQQVRLRYLRDERVTVVTKADGGEWTYFFNAEGQITQIVDPYGGVQKFEIDAQGVVRGERDAAGNFTQYVYDRDGESLAKISPIGIRYGFTDPPPPRYRPHRLPESPRECEFGDLQPGLETADLRNANVTLDEKLPTELEEVTLDAFGKAVKQSARSGAARRWLYDANGNIARYHDFSGETYIFEYASWNHRVRESDPAGNVVRSEFTKLEKLASVTDGGGTEQRYSYDLQGNVTAVHRHGRLLETYEYDVAGNFVMKRDGSGTPLLRFEILPKNLTGARHLTSGDIQRFKYDEAGQYTRAVSEAADVVFAYDYRGRRTKDHRDGRGVEHRYESANAETLIFDRFAIAYGYEPDGAVHIRDCTGATHRIAFQRADIAVREQANGSSELTRFDDAGRIHVKIAFRNQHAGPWIRKYHWSADGDLLAIGDNRFGRTSWRYDRAHRLREMALPDGTREIFAYDAAANLLSGPGLRGVSLRSGNRLATANGDGFEYNDRDHIAKRLGGGGAVSYFYDSRDMLERVEDGHNVWKADYDALGRRVRKTFAGWITEYFWDTDRIAAEISDSGKLRIYVYPDSFALVPFMFIDYNSVDAEPGSGSRYYVFSNHLGAPVLIEDDEGKTMWQCTYTPYGLAHIDRSSTIEYHPRFPGHYFDVETGLHYNRFRYYSPELGRYLQCDPEGIAGGLNLYAYTENPLVQVDTRGLACQAHSISKPDCEDCSNVNRAEYQNQKASRAKGQNTEPVHQLAVAKAKGLKEKHEAEVNRILQLADKEKRAVDEDWAAKKRDIERRYRGDKKRIREETKRLNKERDGRRNEINEKYHLHPKTGLPPHPVLPTTTVAVRDKRTGKVYYGTSGPPALKHGEAHEDLHMPQTSRESWEEPGNCGEPKAINQALQNGARKEDLQVAAVNTETQTPKQLCRNCVRTTSGTTVHSAPTRR
jgi:RHS repeat-associated protein